MSTLPQLNRQTAQIPLEHPDRIVQFGAGNFLRAFADWAIDVMNTEADFDSGVVVVKVTPGQYEELDEQDGLYYVRLEGIENGEFVESNRLITCINRTLYPYDDFAAYLALARQPEVRFLISNTTEAGISFVESDKATDEPPSSFPAKLTLFLHARYQQFEGAADKGCIIIPTELVEDNGTQLRDMVLRYASIWGLETDFGAWITANNIFTNTLVDRIVPGYPTATADEIQRQLGFEDKLLVMGEPYHSWIIEGPQSLHDELPIAQTRTKLNIKIVDDANPYRETKVRILNGLHTSMVPIGILLGLTFVREALDHPALGPMLIDEAHKEIIPSMDLDQDELTQFAADVFDRFRNPSVHHRLLTIATNSSAKERPRILSTLLAYQQKFGELPPRIVLAFAAFIRLYKGEWQGEAIALNDDASILAWFKEQWQSGSVADVVTAVLKNESLWQQDLTAIPGLHAMLTDYLTRMDDSGLQPIIEQINN
ncbi:MAG: tagaturonate reductase [Anaerolineae bacterium]|nr:tagaturonate reductase [Anaerolineae bacterium]